MDPQLTLWIVVFVGGYVAALAYLLRTAMKKKDPSDRDPLHPGGPAGGSRP